jgi:hypothetical protein
LRFLRRVIGLAMLLNMAAFTGYSEKGKWTEEFEAAEFFDTRSDAEQRLTEEKRHPANQNISIVEVELYRD